MTKVAHVRLTAKILLGLVSPLLLALVGNVLGAIDGPAPLLAGVLASASFITAMHFGPRVTALVAVIILVGTITFQLGNEGLDLAWPGFRVVVGVLVGLLAVWVSASRSENQSELNRFSRLASEFEASSKLALFDEMTGIYNRRGVLEALAAESLWPKSVAILDLDKFKAINDEFGHELGDHFIRVMARRTLSSVSASDIVGRWGGDEFIVVLPLGEAQAVAVMRRVIGQISSEPIIKGKMRALAKVSCGVSEWSKSETLEATLSRADVRLFKAKSLGGNQVLGTHGAAV